MLSITIPKDEELVKNNVYYKIRNNRPFLKSHSIWETAIYEIWEYDQYKLFSHLNDKVTELGKEIELSLYICDFSKKTSLNFDIKKNNIIEGIRYCNYEYKNKMTDKLKKLLYLMIKFIEMKDLNKKLKYHIVP